MEALKIILSKVRDGEMSIEEAIILIEAIGVNKANRENKENKSRDLVLDPQETPVTPATPVTPGVIPWTPLPTTPYIGERTTPMPGWNEVICGKSGGIEINKSNTTIAN